MTQIRDAPWIRDAETYGYPTGGYDDEEDEDAKA